MTLSEYFRETKNRFQRHSARTAALDSIHELYIGGLRRVEQQFYGEYDPHWREDWDVLVILDACRVDLLREATAAHEWLPAADELRTLRSYGSTSSEWLQGMFSEEHRGEMDTTGYVTGNMFYEHVDTDPLAFLSVVEPRAIDEYGVTTVPPRDVSDRAIAAWRRRDEFDMDRLIVHYMQPHTPFRSRPEWFDAERPLRTSWGRGFARLRDRDLESREFRAAYRDNLEWVLEDVDLLRRNMDATIGISADHGNGLGERFIYGHPAGVPTPTVRQVPFLELEGTDTETHSPDVTVSCREAASGDVTEHLAALGYR